MRDQRFVAKHRGGPLDKETHRQLAAWAADCAEHLLNIFESLRADDRPRRAVEMARAWSKGNATVGQAQKAAVAAHAAARDAAGNPAACAVARAAGHAVATAHMAEHSLGVVIYGLKAVKANGGPVESEREWQLGRLRPDLRELIVSALEKRLGASNRLRIRPQ